MKYIPKNLTKWTMPDSYFGATWYDYYYAGIGQSRDSDVLEQSNFATMLDALGGESETVVINHCSHWAVGWVESIMIHDSDIQSLKKADELMDSYKSYPVLDENDFSEREYESYSNYAENAKKDVAQVLINLFQLDESLEENKDFLEVCYQLNMECQSHYGSDSCIYDNQFHTPDERDLERIEYCLEQCSYRDYFKTNPAFQFLYSLFGLDEMKGA